jgi:hypothetical protein
MSAGNWFRVTGAGRNVRHFAAVSLRGSLTFACGITKPTSDLTSASSMARACQTCVRSGAPV